MKISSADLEQRWKEFQRDYGNSLRATFTTDHRVANIRSEDTPALGDVDFRSGNKDAALKRAQQILNAATDLVGLNPAFPLAARAIRSDELSSQVEWVQTYDGVPVEPYGRVTVQLDEHGGLRGLYSNYVSDPVIVNEPALNEDSAKHAAFSQIAFQTAHPDQVSAGELVLFAAGPQIGSAQVPLCYAYRFTIDGREVITDASDGKILSQRDRRVF